MDEVVNPAAGDATPDAVVGTETPNDSASETTSQPSTATQKPDLSTILSDPELRQQLLKHPELRQAWFKDAETQAEIDHRASSEAGRRTKAELERVQAQQRAEQERQHAEALLNMDEYELGSERKKEIAAQLEEQALQQRLQPLQRQIQTALQLQAGQEVFGSLYELAKEVGASDEELAELDPRNYGTLGEFVKGAVKFMGTREGKKLAKDLAKAEAKAAVEEALAGVRGKADGPEVLPAAEPGMGDREFLAAFASGTSNDYERARRLTGR